MAILSFVTNHGWLDNLTFRGMREQIINQSKNLTDLNGSAMTKNQRMTKIFLILGKSNVCCNLISGKSFGNSSRMAVEHCNR